MFNSLFIAQTIFPFIDCLMSLSCKLVANMKEIDFDGNFDIFKGILILGLYAMDDTR